MYMLEHRKFTMLVTVHWERRPCMCPASVLASSLDTPLWLFSSALEEAAALETTGLWQALDGYFEGWSGPGWKFSCWLWCSCSSFRIPSCWEGFLFLLFSFPSSPQIFKYIVWRRPLHENRFYNCETRVIQKAFGLFSVVAFVYMSCLILVLTSFPAFSYGGMRGTQT